MPAVREDAPVLASNAQVMVPESLPDVPDVIRSQPPPEVTAAVQAIVPVPALDTLREVDAASFATTRLAGVTDSTGCTGVAACVTVTSVGLPLASLAVTRIVAVLLVVPVLAIYPQVIVPALLPLFPDVIISHSLPDITDAVHDIVPLPALDTVNVAIPVSFDTTWLAGVTDSTVCTGVAACVTVTSVGLPVAPVAVTRIVADRLVVPVLAE
jgi:hypothetical protein